MYKQTTSSIFQYSFFIAALLMFAANTSYAKQSDWEKIKFSAVEGAKEVRHMAEQIPSKLNELTKFKVEPKVNYASLDFSKFNLSLQDMTDLGLVDRAYGHNFKYGLTVTQGLHFEHSPYTGHAIMQSIYRGLLLQEVPKSQRDAIELALQINQAELDLTQLLNYDWKQITNAQGKNWTRAKRNRKIAKLRGQLRHQRHDLHKAAHVAQKHAVLLDNPTLANLYDLYPKSVNQLAYLGIGETHNRFYNFGRYAYGLVFCKDHNPFRGFDFRQVVRNTLQLGTFAAIKVLPFKFATPQVSKFTNFLPVFNLAV